MQFHELPDNGFEPQRERVEAPISYREIVMREHGNSRMWDYLSYDGKGDLIINGLRVVDAVEHVAAIDKEGTPLEITDTTIIERRAHEWEDLTRETAAEVGYTGGFEYYYACKANRTAEAVHAAIRAGWNIETSSKQDIDDLAFLARYGLLDKSVKIVCNGFKLPPDNRWDVVREQTGPDIPGIIYDEGIVGHAVDGDNTYAEKIIRRQKEGFLIAPVLDTGEVDYFIQNSPMGSEVGLRLKFGKVADEYNLARLNSRFGMTFQDLQESADKISQSPNLTLTTLHTMVGAAELMPVDEFTNHLLFAADKYFQLARNYPTLKYLNIGGGIPPLSDEYDHKKLIRTVLEGIKQKAQDSGIPEPTIVFELGSFLSAESGLYVFDIIQVKENSVDEDGKPDKWALVDGNLMEAIPDMLMIQKEFKLISANNANVGTTEVRFGDLTCDSDGRYPPKYLESEKIAMPDAGVSNFLVIVGVGAYQRQLAGVSGGHHCGLLEAAEVVIEKRPDGTHARIRQRQTRLDSDGIFGYTYENMLELRKTQSL